MLFRCGQVILLERGTHRVHQLGLATTPKHLLAEQRQDRLGLVGRQRHAGRLVTLPCEVGSGDVLLLHGSLGGRDEGTLLSCAHVGYLALSRNGIGRVSQHT